jgi:hypothetical protein
LSRLSGWYPQLDGQQRYWDGELWSDSTPATEKARNRGGGGGGRHARTTAVCGWGGLALVVLSGALSSGFGGAATMSGLFALVVGVIALVRGRVGWARLGSRAAGGVALGASMILIAVGAVTG